MPKKFSAAQKREWLERYEKGSDEFKIAKQAGCDVRTVKKGIEEERRIRDARMARLDLLRDAVRRHQDSLLHTVEQIARALKVPLPEPVVPWSWEGNPESVDLEAARAEVLGEGHLVAVNIVLAVENTTEWDLLSEHLKRDLTWKVLAQFKKALAAHLEQKIAMQRKTLSLLKEKTGYQLVDKPIDPPFLYRRTTAPLLYEVALRRLLEIPTSINLEKDITIDTTRREVTHSGAILAKVIGNEEKCRQNILDAFHALEASIKTMRVTQTYEGVEKLTTKAKRIVEELRLSWLVPGRCRVCSRLGM